VINDIDCRLTYMSEEPHMDNGAWDCTLEPVRGRASGGGATPSAES
jgi:hypothetical protein